MTYKDKHQRKAKHINEETRAKVVILRNNCPELTAD